MLKKRIGDQRQCSKKNVFWSLPELFAKVMKSETSLTGSKDVSLIEQSMDIFLFEQWRWQTWLCHLSLGSCMKYFLNTKKQTKNSIPWNIFRSGPVLNITVCSFSAHVVMLSSQSGDCCVCPPLRQLGETLKLPALHSVKNGPWDGCSTCGSIPGVQSLYLPRRRWDLWRGDSSRSWLGRKEYWDAAYASGRYKHTYAPRMERFKRCDMTQDWTVSCGFQWLYQFAVDNLTSCQSTFSLSCLVHL